MVLKQIKLSRTIFKENFEEIYLFVQAQCTAFKTIIRFTEKENDSLVIMFEKLHLCLLEKYFSKRYFYMINFSLLSYPVSYPESF